MAAFLFWLNQNWFSFLQSLGIVGGLWFTAAAIRRDTKARKASDLLKLLEQHRELWSDIHRRPELERVLSQELDLVAQPISIAEEEFINLVIVHFHTGWMLSRSGSTNSLAALGKDVVSFFSLPLPRKVWEKTEHKRDAAFVRFVAKCMKL